MNNPITYLLDANTDQEKIEIIESHMSEIMKVIGLDLSDDSLRGTPKRIAKMWVLESFAGLKESNFPKMTTVENKMKIDQMIKVKDIKVMSVCEHHFVTIDGRAVVAYIPKDKILGLSKINRLVDYYARRPQIQERLTAQIADKLCEILGIDDVAVYINAKHYCVVSRGINDVNSTTDTCELRGRFKTDPTVRAEFLSKGI